MAEQTEKQAENPRTKIREARLARLRLVEGPPNTIKVYAGNEAIRASMRHGGTGIGFRETLGEPVEWPNDSFTHRRIKDGSVRTDGPGPAESAKVDESLNPREQAAAATQHQKKANNKHSSPPPQPAA
jgi:hypothetical protein